MPSARSNAVVCISAGLLRPKKRDTPLARQNLYMNYGLLGLATTLARAGHEPLVIDGVFDPPALVIERLFADGRLPSRHPVLLSLLTLVLGAVWTTGLTALCGVGINPANLVALPLLVGIGINAPVYVIHHARQEPHEALLGSSLGRALIYSALTSVVGFGSLQLAHHRGMASIGSTTAIGVLSCLLAALLVPPPLLALLRRRRPPVATGAPPASSKNQPTG